MQTHPSYINKNKYRALNNNERTKVYKMFIDDKITPYHISVYMNVKSKIIEAVLFSRGSNNKYIVEPTKGIIGFGKQTAYWDNEQQIMDSFDPKYPFEELSKQELAWYMYITRQTKIIISKMI